VEFEPISFEEIAMKRSWIIVGLALGIGAQGVAQVRPVTVGELLRGLQEQPPNQANWVVIPIAGSGPGQNATYHADLAVTASHDYYNDQKVALAWLPVGRDASADQVVFLDMTSEFLVPFQNLRDSFDGKGLGSIVIAAVDETGHLDPLGSVRANVRVWSSSACAGELSLAYRAGHWSGSDRVSAIGLVLGNGFHTNVGITNGDSVAHDWRVRYASLAGGSEHELLVTVPPASSVITGLPPVVDGPISLTVEAPGTGIPWTGWGASVDDTSGDAWYSALTDF
jgi:hypothetical protein